MVAQRLTFFERASLFLSIFRSWIGCSFIAISYGYFRAGWVAATVLLIFYGYLSAKSSAILLRIKYEFLRDSQLSYGGVGDKLFRRGGAVLDSLLVFAQLGFSIAYVIFIVSNVIDMIPGLNPHAVVLLLMIVLSPLCAIDDMRKLSALSSLASVLMFVGLVYCFMSFESVGAGRGPVVAVQWYGVPIFIGMSSSAMMGIGVVLPMEADLQKRFAMSQFAGPSVTKLFVSYLNAAVGLSCVILIVFGFYGYLSYGALTESVITINLTDGAAKTWIQILFVSSVFLTFPMVFYVARSVMEKYLLPPKNSKSYEPVLAISFRISLCVIVCVSALRIPHFGILYSLVGAFAGSLLAFIFPLIFSLKMEDSGKKYRFTLMYLALIFMIIATCQASYELFTSGDAAPKSNVLQE